MSPLRSDRALRARGGWAGFVWGYALLWFLLDDRVNCSRIGY